MKIITAAIILLLIASTHALNISVNEGDVTDLGDMVITPYAIVKGSVQFKIGNITWYPQEVWVVPSGTRPESFKSTGATNELANVSDFGKCTTNVYSNASIGYAYKITASNIIKGKFCAAIASGNYEVLIR